jgi:hypothetical protein
MRARPQTGPACTTSPGASAPGDDHGTSGTGQADPASAATWGDQRPAQHTTTSAGMTRPVAVRTACTEPRAASMPATRHAAPVRTVAPRAAASLAIRATRGSVRR